MAHHIVLTFDDACRSHLTTVAPELRRYGFGATFFICRFDDDYRRQFGNTLLAPDAIRELSAMGLDIGNHTWSHRDLRAETPDAIRSDLRRMQDFLTAAGVPECRSFAYPGGPYAENAAPVLRDFGFRFARTTERRLYAPGVDDPLRLPAIPIQHEDPAPFQAALAMLDAAPEDQVLILVYHGVPDEVHPHVNTPPEIFRAQLAEMAERGYRATGLAALL